MHVWVWGDGVETKAQSSLIISDEKDSSFIGCGVLPGHNLLFLRNSFMAELLGLPTSIPQITVL